MARAIDIKTQEMYRNIEDERSCTLYFEDPRVFSAEKILDIRAITTEIEYLIKFTGYDARYNEWVVAKDVTPDLKRAFSQEKKKKDIQTWKKPVAKTRTKRTTIVGLTPSPVDVRRERRNTKIFRQSESVTMLDESDLEIPEWTILTDEKEYNERMDTSMSVTSSLNESEFETSIRSSPTQGNEENDMSLSTVLSAEQSQLEISERTKLPDEIADDGNGKLMHAGLMLGRIFDTQLQESDQSSSFGSFSLVLESESDFDSFGKKNEPDEYLLGFDEQLDPVFTYV